jgi:hypothetical protein
MHPHKKVNCDVALYIDENTPNTPCAANFSFAQLAKRKSLGRSKPATTVAAQSKVCAQSIAHSHIGDNICKKKLNF